MCCCVNNIDDGSDGVLWILLTEPETQKPGCLGLVGTGKKKKYRVCHELIRILEKDNV